MGRLSFYCFLKTWALIPIAIGIAIMSPFLLAAQYKGPHFPINDKEFWQHASKGLQEGDKMPDISLGSVMNNKTGKKRFSDFKGKLVILDFWNTYCSSCIAAFPEMEQLQKQFGDKIQVILVNTRESEADIIRRRKEVKSGINLLDLPSIVSNHPFISIEDANLHPHPLEKLFANYGIPSHIWIDAEGIIRLKGSHVNTYAEKINDFLQGKPITYLKDNMTIPSLLQDTNAKYYQQLAFLKNTPVSFGSFLTPFNNEIVGISGSYQQVVDSNSKARINDVMNMDLFDLYEMAFKNAFGFGQDSIRKSILYGGVELNFVTFPPGIDSLDYTSKEALYSRSLTTEEIIRGKYCYEQILPLETDVKTQGKYMIEDLNRYFSLHYGMIAELEKRIVPSYQLIRTSDVDKLSRDNKNPVGQAIEMVSTSGTEKRTYNCPLEFLVYDLIQNSPELQQQFAQNSKKHEPFLIINKTGWLNNKEINIQLPATSLTTIADLQKLLAPYDLDIVQKGIQIEFLVFKKVR